MTSQLTTARRWPLLNHRLVYVTFIDSAPRYPGLPLSIRDRATGGGTDAAFAGLRPRGGVLESFGLRGFGAHSNDNEYIPVSNIVPRLYLATRVVMDLGRGAVKW